MTEKGHEANWRCSSIEYEAQLLPRPYASMKSSPPKYSIILRQSPSSSPSSTSPPKIRLFSASSFSHSSLCRRSRTCHAMYRLCQCRAETPPRRLTAGPGGASSRGSGGAEPRSGGKSKVSCCTGIPDVLWLPRARRRLWRLIVI